MKQSKHNVKPIALYLDRGFVFLCNNCKRFFRFFDLWFLFPILCKHIKKVKMRHIQHQLLFLKLSFFVFEIIKSDFSCSSILLSLTYSRLDAVHIVLMSFITSFFTEQSENGR